MELEKWQMCKIKNSVILVESKIFDDWKRMKQKIIDVNRYQWEFMIKNFFLLTLLNMRIKKVFKTY